MVPATRLSMDMARARNTVSFHPRDWEPSVRRHGSPVILTMTFQSRQGKLRITADTAMAVDIGLNAVIQELDESQQKQAYKADNPGHIPWKDQELITFPSPRASPRHPLHIPFNKATFPQPTWTRLKLHMQGWPQRYLYREQILKSDFQA